MTFNCPYCNSLQKAFKDHNYCSNKGDKIAQVKSNAFYMNSRRMNSGKHISRLSIRSVLNGYQYYQTGNKDRIVKKDNYLIINEGQQWYSEIDSEQAVEMVVVAFHSEVLKKGIYSLSSTPLKLLDDPFSYSDKDFFFSENTYPNCEELQYIIKQLKNGILEKQYNHLFYDQIYFDLLTLMFRKHQHLLEQAELIPSKKKSIREELLKRLGVAKDYIDAHLSTKIHLENISKIATLSPYHFLRLFKSVYKITPHQYLIQERMKYAYYLLESSNISVEKICYKSGFENPSSFGRAFKSFFKKTPLSIRH